MRIRSDFIGSAAIIGALVVFWISEEAHYTQSISPEGISTVRDYFSRFGEPVSVRRIALTNQTCYEFTGRSPSTYWLVLPSAPPAYIFDQNGRFITWCKDPGDRPSHRLKWPLEGTNQIEISVVRQKLGLNEPSRR